MKKRIVAIIGIILILLLPVSVAFAIATPDAIAFGVSADTNIYLVFEDVNSSGDMLFVAETLVEYAATPTDYSSAEAFSFQLIDTDNTTVLFSTPILSYGGYVHSIYLTPAQSVNVTWDGAYKLRITGNPAIFGVPIEGSTMVTRTLQPTDYIENTPAGSTPSYLRMFCLSIAGRLETYDTDTYTVVVEGVTYLDADGSNIFLDGIPGLNTFAPLLFQSKSGVVVVEIPESTGAYTGNLTVTTGLGAAISTGVDLFADWFSISKILAGTIILFAITTVIAGVAYVKTQQTILPPAIAIIMPILGGVFGLIPFITGAIVTIVIAILTVWFFVSKGSI